MSTISVNADNAKILLALVQDMVANRMAVHQATPEIQTAVQELAAAIDVAEAPAEEPAAQEPPAAQEQPSE